MNNYVFVKLNFKNINQVKSLIVDKKDPFTNNSGKYIMCSGKYTKDGWTIVFKAKSYHEAEYIINNTYLNEDKDSYMQSPKSENIDIPLDISILSKRQAFAY